MWEKVGEESMQMYLFGLTRKLHDKLKNTAEVVHNTLAAAKAIPSRLKNLCLYVMVHSLVVASNKIHVYAVTTKEESIVTKAANLFSRCLGAVGRVIKTFFLVVYDIITLKSLKQKYLGIVI